MNQNPKQLSRDVIDVGIGRKGWVILRENTSKLPAALLDAVHEYQPTTFPADCILLARSKRYSATEAKLEEEGAHLMTAEDHSLVYSDAEIIELKRGCLHFVYMSKSEQLMFTNCNHSKTRLQQNLSFHCVKR